jgi:hypothetical protein
MKSPGLKPGLFLAASQIDGIGLGSLPPFHGKSSMEKTQRCAADF